MAKLNQKVEETEKENLVLRKDKEMNKMLIEKQLRKIKELCQAVDKSRQGDDRDILDYEENGKYIFKYIILNECWRII